MEKRMNILVLGGTGFFGKHLVWELLHRGHEVTIATRGRTPDDFGDRVRRLIVDRTDVRQMEQVFAHKYYDVFYDDLAYCAGGCAHRAGGGALQKVCDGVLGIRV